MFRMKTAIAATLAACVLAPWALPAGANELKFDEPLRIIAPAAPGGILDLTSRVVGKALSDVIKQTVIVENAPGGGGVIGIQAMLRAKPDGHTLVMGSLGPNAANYTLYPKLSYKPEDMVPVVHVLSMPNVLVASVPLGAKTVADLKALSKAKPGGLSMAVSTTGSSGHLTGELLKSGAGIDAVNIVYRGAAPALTDLISGRVDLMVDNLITSLPQIRAGKLVPIAVTSRGRVPELPDVPSLVESGFPDLEVAVWLGIFVSSKTPPATVVALNAALQKALSSAEVRETFSKWGGVAVGGTPASFNTFVTAEKDRWARVIRAADIKIE